MKFRVEIDCDGAAFYNPEGGHDPAAEIASILEHFTVHRLREGITDSPLFDTNGNRVGRAWLESSTAA